MKGTNDFHLNEETMIEIVQEWLDGQMPTSKSKVTSVKGGNGTYDNTFKITVSEPTPAPV